MRAGFLCTWALASLTAASWARAVSFGGDLALTSDYIYRGYSESYRPAYRPRVAYYHQRRHYEGYPAYRHRSHHGSRRGYWRPVELPPK